MSQPKSNDFQFFVKAQLQKTRDEKIQQLLKNAERFTMCQTCNVEMQSNNNELICPKCQKFKISIEEDINCYENKAGTHKPSAGLALTNGGGRGRVMGAVNSESKQISIRQKIEHIASRLHTKWQIPESVKHLVENVFMQIYQDKERHIFKKNNRDSMILFLIIHFCEKLGVGIKPSEIDSIDGLDKTMISTGNKKLEKYKRQGLIKLDSDTNKSSSYSRRYLQELGFDIKYHQLIDHIIQVYKNERIEVKTESRNSTRVIALIYVVMTSVPNHPDSNLIRKKITDTCEIATNTFNTCVKEMIRYSFLVYNDFVNAGLNPPEFMCYPLPEKGYA